MLRWAMMHMGDGSNGRGHAGAAQEMVEEMLEKILPQKGGTIWQCSIRSTVQAHTNWLFHAVKKGGDMHALLTCRMSMHTCESGHGWGWAHHFCRFRCGVFATIFAILNLIGFFEGRGFLSVVKPARNRTNKLGCAGIVEGVCVWRLRRTSAFSFGGGN